MVCRSRQESLRDDEAEARRARRIAGGPLLDLVMDDQLSDIVLYFKRKMGLSQTDAEVLFMDVKRFLYLCYTNGRASCIPPPYIDKGWHMFFEHTETYEFFCHYHFARMIHHYPLLKVTPRIKELAVETRNKALERFGELSSNWDLSERFPQEIENEIVHSKCCANSAVYSH